MTDEIAFYKKLSTMLMESKAHFYVVLADMGQTTENIIHAWPRKPGDPGIDIWNKYVEEYAMPLNARAAGFILANPSYLPSAPNSVWEFLTYNSKWTEDYLAYKAGKNPEYRFTAQDNFPSTLDQDILRKIITLRQAHETWLEANNLSEEKKEVLRSQGHKKLRATDFMSSGHLIPLNENDAEKIRAKDFKDRSFAEIIALQAYDGSAWRDESYNRPA
jgi:hypothetical protein